MAKCGFKDCDNEAGENEFIVDSETEREIPACRSCLRKLGVGR